MEAFLPRSRGRRKQGRSQSLPGRIDPVLREKTEEILRNKPPGTGDPDNDGAYSQPRLIDEWAHLPPDERGAELSREARVWRVYVGETDKWDKEVVEGWDKSMDVLLVFAALFSAISATFLIESSGMLKQDPNDVSAAALLAISQALNVLATSNGSTNSSILPSPQGTTASDFVPSQTAVVVNTLWYTSLSLSIATAFLAMLAKDWCYSFLAHRTGHPRDQAHRRQRKWQRIVDWKMEELIVGLPLLMHLSLLLFAVGLCIYLWNLNHTIAVPVVCIAGASLAFYICSSTAACFVEDFPYTTVVSRLLRSERMRYIRDILLVLLSAIFYLAWAVISLVFYLGCYVLFLLVFLPLEVVVLFSVLGFCVLACITPLTMRVTLNAFVHEVYFTSIMDLFSNKLLDSHLKPLVSLPFRVLDKIKDLELSEDLTTSLLLSWLIQHCETPSAVDIALQAIAGASQKIPKEPLLASRATEHILRRIVLHDAQDGEKSKNSLYIRGLVFMGLDSSSNTGNAEHGFTGDIEVMMWDLKSNNARMTAELIKDGSFIPSDHNLEAMRIGNSATTQTLKILIGKNMTSQNNIRAIADLLSRHFGPGDEQLHPAALQSLANAAALHMSVSTHLELPPGILNLFVRHCEHLICDGTRLTLNHATGIAFVICVLMRRSGTIDKPTDTTRLINQQRTRAMHVIHVLMQDQIDHRILFWIGYSEILSKPSKYGLVEEAGVLEPSKNWCSKYASHFTLNDFARYNKSAKRSREKFLAAISLVYERIIPMHPYGSEPPHLPEPIHTILAMLAWRNLLDPPHTQVCYELLSKFGFPRLNDALIASLELPVNSSVERVPSSIRSFLPQLDNTTTNPFQTYFAATQLWLLLDLTGNLSDEDQRMLKAKIEHDFCEGIDQIKDDLEVYIIRGYQMAHRARDRQTGAGRRSSLSRRQVHYELRVSKLGLPLIGAAQTQTRWRTSQVDRIRQVLRSEIGDLTTMGTNQRLYTARIIERILETRGLQGHEHLLPLLANDFKMLPPWFQNHSPVLAPMIASLPPSSAASQISVRTEAISPDEFATEPHSIDAGHVTVAVDDSPTVTNSEGS